MIPPEAAALFAHLTVNGRTTKKGTVRPIQGPTRCQRPTSRRPWASTHEARLGTETILPRTPALDRDRTLIFLFAASLGTGLAFITFAVAWLTSYFLLPTFYFP